MVLYKCQNCLKEFKKKDDYVKHTERRKTPCQTIININHSESLMNHNLIEKNVD